MKAFLKLLILGPIAIVVMALAVVNNQPVRIAFDPFTPEAPILSVTVPLYAVFFVALMAGVLLGGFGTWTGQGRFRKAARENKREAQRWKVEADRLKEETQRLPEAEAPVALPGRKAA
ncbi:LapA family protein [Oryzibacter oryziterrae]|uniref:LapA family protein n=1 Tax=Oryzibacter oryziterrae TaxID=2766474 RepID=UPI001F448691|nr:LapA family protein [Oryzibacter oryziterrae]